MMIHVNKHLVFLLCVITFTQAKNLKISNKSASQFLASNRASNRDNKKVKNQELLLELKNELANEKSLHTRKDWENYKEQLEGGIVLNREVDAFEVCISDCESADEKADFEGVAYEELRESFEDDFEVGGRVEKPKNMCLQCFDVFPVSQIRE